tara:strand:- start:49 stop:228 length:180 start_codon:yes stop_codon:yes gene_type:complete
MRGFDLFFDLFFFEVDILLGAERVLFSFLRERDFDLFRNDGADFVLFIYNMKYLNNKLT